MARTFRVFISSPSDVLEERDVVQKVCARLAQEFHEEVALEVIRWEDQHYSAATTFQTQITSPADCDLVVFIAWKKLGTPLPEQFARPDGTVPTGTEYEFETALAAARASPTQTPAMLVYRKQVTTLNVASLETEKLEYDRVQRFWKQWFLNEKGHVAAAFKSFSASEDLEVQFEKDLRSWLRSELGGGLWSIAEKGSPYRGLQAFDAHHAPVFFGRRRAIREARAKLASACLRDCGFLAILGASGSGKSSLVSAGLGPALTTQHFYEGVLVRYFTQVQPPEPGISALETLAKALFDAIEELRAGDFATPQDLAHYWMLEGSDVAAPVVRAIARASHRGVGNLDKSLGIISFDQFEWLLLADPGERRLMLRVIDGLARSGATPVIISLRNDFYPALLAEPVLVALREDGASLDLVPPNLDELRDIIEGPANAAGLLLETDASGVLLSDLLLAEVSPSYLPMLQFALSRLFDIRDAATNSLRIADLERIGGVGGAVAEYAEFCVSSFGADELQESMSQLVRLLTNAAALSSGEGDATPATSRTALRSSISGTASLAALVDALVEARLIVADAGSLRFVHERLIMEWPRLRAAWEGERHRLVVAARVAEQCSLWCSAPNASERRKRLLSGLPLSEARALRDAWQDVLLAERHPDLKDFIDQSYRADRARRGRFVQFVAAVAAVLGVTAIWAVSASLQSEDSRRLAVAQLARAAEAQVEIFRRDAKADAGETSTQDSLAKATAAFASIPGELNEAARDWLESKIDPIWSFHRDRSRIISSFASDTNFSIPSSNMDNPVVLLEPDWIAGGRIVKRIRDGSVVGRLPPIGARLQAAYQHEQAGLLVLLYWIEPRTEEEGAASAHTPDAGKTAAPGYYAIEARKLEDLTVVSRVGATDWLLCAGAGQESINFVFVDGDNRLVIFNSRSGIARLSGSVGALWGSPRTYAFKEEQTLPYEKGQAPRKEMVTQLVGSRLRASCAFDDATGAVAIAGSFEGWSGLGAAGDESLPGTIEVSGRAAIPAISEGALYVVSRDGWRRERALPRCHDRAWTDCPFYRVVFTADGRALAYPELARNALPRQLKTSGTRQELFDLTTRSPKGETVLAADIVQAWPAWNGMGAVVERETGLFFVPFDGAAGEGLTLREVQLIDAGSEKCLPESVSWSSNSKRFAVMCSSPNPAAPSMRRPQVRTFQIYVAPWLAHAGVRLVQTTREIAAAWSFSERLSFMWDNPGFPNNQRALAGRLTESGTGWTGDDLVVMNGPGFQIYKSPSIASPWGSRYVLGTSSDGKLYAATEEGLISEFDASTGNVRIAELPFAKDIAAFELETREVARELAAEKSRRWDEARINAEANAANSRFESLQVTGGAIAGKKHPYFFVAITGCRVDVFDTLAFKPVGVIRPCTGPELMSVNQYHMDVGVSGDFIVYPRDKQGYTAYRISNDMKPAWTVSAGSYPRVAEAAGIVASVESKQIVFRDISTGKVVRNLASPAAEVFDIYFSPDAATLVIQGSQDDFIIRYPLTKAETTRLSDASGSILLETGHVVANLRDDRLLLVAPDGSKREVPSPQKGPKLRPLNGSRFTMLEYWRTPVPDESLPQENSLVLEVTDRGVRIVGRMEQSGISTDAFTASGNSYTVVSDRLFSSRPVRPSVSIALWKLQQDQLFPDTPADDSIFDRGKSHPSAKPLPQDLVVGRFKRVLLGENDGNGYGRYTSVKADPLDATLKAYESIEARWPASPGDHPVVYLLVGGNRWPITDADVRKLRGVGATLEGLAKRGDAIAEYLLGYLYLVDLPTRDNLEDGIAAFTSACRAGLAYACVSVGIEKERIANGVAAENAARKAIEAAAAAYIAGATLDDAYAWFRVGQCFSEPKVSKICDSVGSLSATLGLKGVSPPEKAIEAFALAEMFSANDPGFYTRQLASVVSAARAKRVTLAQILKPDQAERILAAVLAKQRERGAENAPF